MVGVNLWMAVMAVMPVKAQTAVDSTAARIGAGVGILYTQSTIAPAVVVGIREGGGGAAFEGARLEDGHFTFAALVEHHMDAAPKTTSFVGVGGGVETFTSGSDPFMTAEVGMQVTGGSRAGVRLWGRAAYYVGNGRRGLGGAAGTALGIWP